MKRIYTRLSITLYVIFSVSVAYAHNPNVDSLDLYIDNIPIGKHCCVLRADCNVIPSVLMEYYYCAQVLDCNKSDSTNLFDCLHLRKIKRMYVKPDCDLCVTGNMYIRTKEANDGYLYINKEIVEAIERSQYSFREVNILLFYNGQVIITKRQVQKFVELRKKRIVDLRIEIDNSLKTVRVYVVVTRRISSH